MTGPLTKQLTIGAVARQAGVGVETIRYYEREGLLPAPERSAAGYRLYTAEAVSQLQFILRAKTLGFTLKEIESLQALQFDRTASRADVRQQVRHKVQEMEAKIADLQRMRAELLSLIQECHGEGIAAECPIITALQGERAGSEEEELHDHAEI